MSISCYTIPKSPKNYQISLMQPLAACFFILLVILTSMTMYLSSFFFSFSTGATRSSSIKLRHNKCTINKVHHFYFNRSRISHLWNSIPIIDLSLSFSTIKQRIKTYFWEHLMINFHSDDPHKLYSLCPCSSCAPINFPMNYDHL